MDNKEKDTVEILCIGTELLLGNILNTNAQWIAEQISCLGFSHYRQTVVGDNLFRLKETINEISNRCRFLITTGGLGPTVDDLTHKTIASTFNINLEEREEVIKDIKAKLSNKHNNFIPVNNYKQALFPLGAEIIPNLTGTAPGMIWSPKKDFTILTFPGVPSELKQMWKDSAVFWLQKNNSNDMTLVSKVIRTVEISESYIAEQIHDLIDNNNPTIAPYAGIGEVKLRLTAKAKNIEEGENLISPIQDKIIDRLGVNCFGFNEDSLASSVINLLRKSNQTLAIAESCTGGGLGAEISSIAGCSDVFLGGVIAYQNEIKENFLGVKGSLLSDFGAVSEEVVRSMAEGVRLRFKSDWSIAISGLAGPEGGSALKPIGLVQIGIAGPKVTESTKKTFDSGKGRKNIQKLSVVCSLNALRIRLLAQD